LVIRFDLPSSCYATMCFRELFKMPTNLIFQKSLTEEFVLENSAAASSSKISEPVNESDGGESSSKGNVATQ